MNVDQAIDNARLAELSITFDSIEELKAWCSTLAKINFSMVFLAGLTFVFIMIILVIVFKIVQFRNITVLLIIGLCALECISKIILYSFNGSIYVYCGDWSPDIKWFSIIAAVPASTFLLVVIVNLNSWSHYYFKIEEMSVFAKDYAKKSKFVKKFKTFINFITIIASAVVVFYTLFLCIKGSSLKDDMKNHMFVAAGVMLIVTGFLFWLQGVFINLLIKKNFSDFYQNNKITLWFPTYLLSVPIIIRGGIDIARVMDKDFDERVDDHREIFTITFYIFTDLFPLCF